MSIPHPKNGHLRIPNELVEQLAKLRLNGTQWQIIWAVCRKTLCWQLEGEWTNRPYPISLRDIAAATGLNKRQVTRGVTELVKKHILIRESGHQKAITSFNLEYKSWVVAKKSPVTNSSLPSITLVTSTSDKKDTNLVSEKSLSTNTKSYLLNKPNKTRNKNIKEIDDPDKYIKGKYGHCVIRKGEGIQLLKEIRERLKEVVVFS